MAADNWLLIFRTYSAEELAIEIDSLKTQLKNANGITGQTSGSKSYTRDLLNLEGKLGAACQIYIEKTQSGMNARMRGGWAIPDFSGIRG